MLLRYTWLRGLVFTCLHVYGATTVFTWVRGYAAVCPRFFVVLFLAAGCYVPWWLLRYVAA